MSEYKKYLDESLSAQERAEALVSEMTVEEMASQLRYDAPSVERLNIPAYNWWNEALHGVAREGTATMFPQAIALAAMFNPGLTHRAAEITSYEARAKYNANKKHGDRDIYKGLTMWAPNINIFRDPRWGRGHETYGEDPYLTALNGLAWVSGLQGDGKTMRTAACAKHFAVHSGPESLRHSFNAKASAKDLEETYLTAFEVLVRNGVESVMGAYNRLNDEVCCASDYLMNKLREWGFDGYFVSDCWAIRDFHENHKVCADSVSAAAMALKAGCDVNCGCTYVNILAALDEGLITEEDIRKACVHLMRTRFRLGMFDEKTEYDDLDYSIVSCDEHKNIAYKCALESIVMLENNGILPLDESKIKTIGVIGPVADSRTVLEGNYNGTADRYITILEGIEDRFDGRVLYSEGCHLYKDRTSGLAQAGDRYAEAVTVAENSDVVILCVGLDSTLEGEEGDTGNEFSSGDKKDLRLPESQRILIEKIKATGKPIVLLCTTGSAINTEIVPDALLQLWYPGQMGGRAAADIIFGDYSPCGKLPVTFYRDSDKLPDFTDYSMKNRTYRYTDENILYPFGYGLTYSEVVCSDMSFNNGRVSLRVTNKGKRIVRDTVQVYIKAYDENAVPFESLCGIGKVLLKAGESTFIDIDISPDAFTTVDENGKRDVYGKRFTIYAGTHRPDALSCRLSGSECISTEVYLND